MWPLFQHTHMLYLLINVGHNLSKRRLAACPMTRQVLVGDEPCPALGFMHQALEFAASIVVVVVVVAVRGCMVRRTLEDWAPDSTHGQLCVQDHHIHCVDASCSPQVAAS